MAVPKYKSSKARSSRKRTLAMKKKAPSLVECSNCKSYILPHRVCPHCKFYKNALVENI